MSVKFITKQTLNKDSNFHVRMNKRLFLKKSSRFLVLISLFFPRHPFFGVLRAEITHGKQSGAHQLCHYVCK